MVIHGFSVQGKSAFSGFLMRLVRFKCKPFFSDAWDAPTFSALHKRKARRLEDR
jgi:putative component of membrane protein insertase Oxa1/YidC/SpoIIIJ protein YidD